MDITYYSNIDIIKILSINFINGKFSSGHFIALSLYKGWFGCIKEMTKLIFFTLYFMTTYNLLLRKKFNWFDCFLNIFISFLI